MKNERVYLGHIRDAIADIEAYASAGREVFMAEQMRGWIGHITSDVFWLRLVALRAEALRLELPSVAGIITGTMAKIDGIRVAGVIREQVPVTPVDWRGFQTVRAAEYEWRQSNTTAYGGTPALPASSGSARCAWIRAKEHGSC